MIATFPSVVVVVVVRATSVRAFQHAPNSVSTFSSDSSFKSNEVVCIRSNAGGCEWGDIINGMRVSIKQEQQGATSEEH